MSAMALAGFAMLGTTAAHAQAPCDAYSGACVEGTKNVKPPVRPSVGGLPFTGAEITGLALIGGVAVAGGTVLVSAGRRRRAPQPA
jgi:hypothetical protein